MLTFNQTLIAAAGLVLGFVATFALMPHWIG
jgi:hypothetical protein